MISHAATDVVVVLTTWPADREPSTLARPLVEEQLAACVNVLPTMESTYRWQGRIHEDAERQVIIKARRDRLEALHARLVALHPYEVPEFLVIEVTAGASSYLDWIRAGE